MIALPRAEPQGPAFDYTEDSLAEARRRHPFHLGRIRETDRLRMANLGVLSIEPLMSVAFAMLAGRYWITGTIERATFEAWRHPCGGRGVVYGMELINPATALVDPRHPW